MARRSGQSGYVERNGNAYYVRFWTDVPGQEKGGPQERPAMPGQQSRQGERKLDAQ